MKMKAIEENTRKYREKIKLIEAAMEEEHQQHLRGNPGRGRKAGGRRSPRAYGAGAYRHGRCRQDGGCCAC